MKRQQSQNHLINQKISSQENISASQSSNIRKITRNGNILTQKKLKLKPDDSVIPPNIIRELAIPSELNSPYIMHPPLSDIHYEPDEQSISYIYEFGAVDLRKVQCMYFNKQTPINETSVKSIIFQILLGLEYMHARGVAHCNVTPEHLMIMPQTCDAPGVLRFINFSLARVSDTLTKVRPSSAINIGYRAPEIIIGSPDYGYSADIWAAGVIFSELLTGQLFYTHRQSELDQQSFQHMALFSYVENIGPISSDDFPRHENYSNWQNFQTFLNQIMANPNLHSTKGKLQQKLATVSADAQDLLFRMLAYNPDRRISAREALRHPYFNTKPYPMMNLIRTFPADDWKVLIQARAKE